MKQIRYLLIAVVALGVFSGISSVVMCKFFQYTESSILTYQLVTTFFTLARLACLAYAIYLTFKFDK